jgi:hypothetical protein
MRYTFQNFIVPFCITMPTQQKIRHTGQSALFEEKKKLMRRKRETQNKIMEYRKTMYENSVQRDLFLIDQKIARQSQKIARQSQKIASNSAVKKKKKQETDTGCTIS